MNCNNEETIDEDNYFGNNVRKICIDGNFNNLIILIMKLMKKKEL